MDAALSVHEKRRRAPLHFWAKAENARLVAYVLWLKDDPSERLSEAASNCGYRGTPSIAAHEGFLRESALALELIVKAVIAQKIEFGCAPPGVLQCRGFRSAWRSRVWLSRGCPIGQVGARSLAAHRTADCPASSGSGGISGKKLGVTADIRHLNHR
jgi:hypothetical protein